MKTPCQDDPELWLAEKAADRHEAMRRCAPCHRLRECLTEALANREMFGVFGGNDFSHATTRPKLPPAPPKPIRHGTEGGHKAHKRRGEDPCGACIEANRSAQALRRPSRAKGAAA